MKTKILRTVAVVVMVGGLGWAVSQEDNMPQEPKKPEAEAAVTNAPVPGNPATNAPAPDKSVALPAAEKVEASPTNAPKSTPPASAATNAANPDVRLVRSFTPPSNLKLSPGLEEIIKLVQAGVSEEVLLAYIDNSTNIFNVSSDEIVYLNDIGVSSTVMTTLIQHDASPETMARKQAAVAVTPLPPGVALKTPATNIYPVTASPPPLGADVPGNTFYTEPVAAPPEPTPVAMDENTMTSTQMVYVTQQVTSVSYFYDSLAPYGNWVSVPDYGLCWQPTVAVVDYSWRPYCHNGRWMWTDAGWYWYSSYSWGWAPFHYGRWCTYPGYGWLWVPDTVWGPSWVTWRYTPYHCGWAPLPPRCHYVNGFGLYYGGGSVGVGFGFGFGYDHYTFVASSRFCEPNLHHYYVPRDHARTIYRDSTVVNNIIVGNNNTIINNGIGVDRVAKATRGEIPRATVRDTAFSKSHNVRLERLEHRNNELAVTRATLPKEPPVSPASIMARTQAAPVAGTPYSRNSRVTPRNAGTAERSPAAATPAPVVPDTSSTRFTAPGRPERPSSVSSSSRVVPDSRRNPRTVEERSASSSSSGVASPPSSLAATDTRNSSDASTTPASSSSRVQPVRPTRSSPSSSSTTMTPSSTPRSGTQSVPSSTSRSASSTRIERPATRAEAPRTPQPSISSPPSPQPVTRPAAPATSSPRSVPSSSSFTVRSDPPRAASPSVSIPVAPSVRATPSAPASPSYSAPAPRSAPSPSVSAPAPSRSSGNSGSGGGSGSSGSSGGGSKPVRPGR